MGVGDTSFYTTPIQENRSNKALIRPYLGILSGCGVWYRRGDLRNYVSLRALASATDLRSEMATAELGPLGMILKLGLELL